MRMKTHKKSAAFWKHGKHKGLLHAKLALDRTSTVILPEPMYGSVQEAMEAERKKIKK